MGDPISVKVRAEVKSAAIIFVDISIRVKRRTFNALSCWVLMPTLVLCGFHMDKDFSLLTTKHSYFRLI